MRIHRFAALAAAFFTATPLLAAVTVTHGDPDKFTDAGDRNTDPRKVMPGLAKRLEDLGAKRLPERNIAIEILALHRAGPPRMNLPTAIRGGRGKGAMPC